MSNLPLFFTALGASLFGLLMIYSSSAILGMQRFSDGLFFVKNQALSLAAGWVLYFLIAQLPIYRLTRYRIFFLLGAVVILLMVFLPGLGVSAGGAQRWINLGFATFQPAEFVRLFLIFYLAGTLVEKKDKLHSFNRGFLPLLLVSSILMFLLVLQPDFGSAMSVLILSYGLWFVGGVPWGYLLGLAVLVAPAMMLVLFQASYRVQRLMTFLDPWKDPQGAGFQVIQSFMAFFEGGWLGVGLGNSQQKLFYLPEAHTDFIFSVVGEELGLFGVLIVVSLFISILYFGIQISRQQSSQVSYYLGLGLVMMLCMPALLNMMVTLGMLPTKGLPLPLLSYGRNSAMVSLIALGMLQSLNFRARQGDH
ncbi:MAG: putative lipid II flippase FtsW [Bdellovibrionota bacterium]